MTMSREKAIIRFLDDLEGLNMHGFQLMLEGRILAEGSWAPFEADAPHRLYSVSKSVTSLAIGMLAEDGVIRLTDPIVSYFPAWVGEDTPELLRQVTILDMLRMATCYDRSMYSPLRDRDWTQPFFRGKPTHVPGTVFSYDTSASQVMCALVEKKTGRSILDFMEERLFRPLGMAGEKRWLKDGEGVSQGGTGLIMSLRDFGKLADFCMSDGRGLISEEYLRSATACQIDTPERSAPEERHGYGYQFWRMRRGFSMYGLGGQMAMCLPEKQLCLCTTADLIMDSTGVQPLYDAFFRHLEHIDQLPSDPLDAHRLQARLDSLRVPALHGGARELSVSLQQGTLPFHQVWVEDGLVGFCVNGQRHDLPFGRGAWVPGCFPTTRERCITSGGWTGENRFRLHCELNGDCSCAMELHIVLREGRATVRVASSLGEVALGWGGQDWGTVQEARHEHH